MRVHRPLALGEGEPGPGGSGGAVSPGGVVGGVGRAWPGCGAAFFLGWRSGCVAKFVTPRRFAFDDSGNRFLS